MRETHKWTEDERNIIRRDYRHTRASSQEIAARLGVSEFAVKGQVSEMGIAKRDDRRPWTPEEKEKLADLINRYCIRRVAQKMHRSLNSVGMMSRRMGLSRRDRTGWFTKQEVCAILGHGHKWVQVRIDSGALEATYHYEHRPTQIGQSAWHIEEKSLVKFIRTYPEDMVGVNLDIMTIVDILAGILNNNH